MIGNMLEFIRKHRALFSLIFVLSAVGMVVSMFAHPRGMGGFSGLSGGVVAQVDGREIQTSELLQAYQNEYESARQSLDQQVKQMGNSPEIRKYLEARLRSSVTPDAVLAEIVRQKFAVATADRMGIATPAESIRDRIAEIPDFQREGRFDPLIYKERVAAPAVFEKRLAESAMIESLQGVFISSLAILSPLESTESRFLSQPRSFESLSLDPHQFPEPKSVAPAEVAAFVADPQSGPKLQAYYERNKSRFQKGEEVHAKHILFKGDDAGLKLAKETLAAIRAGGKKFDAAAKEYSQDKSNAGQGGDLGFFGRGVMDPAFEQAAFGLAKAGDLSEPVKSSFGYHLIELVDRHPALNRGFDEVKNEIASDALLGEKRIQKAREWLNGWVTAGRVPSDAELKARGLSWKKIPGWTPTDERLGDVGPVEGFLGELLALSKDNPLLKRVLNEGESLVVVRRVESKDAAEPSSALQARYRKISGGLEQFLRTRFESLEKNKKIVRSEKTLAGLRAQLGSSEGDGG
jgi:parvulin-like peptidyl-prolyl isomerase